MCTLTYIPKDFGYFFTSNRDERQDRNAASEPIKKELYGTQVHYPQDSLAGGTWFAVSENGFSLCLLNGAFEKHIRNAPYRMSRGLMLLEFFKYQNAQRFHEEFSFENIEPFTLVIINDSKAELHEIRWDGKLSYFKELDSTEAQIWSSATLYPQPIRDQRAAWFKEALQKDSFHTQEDVLRFHRFSGSGDRQNDLVMERGNLLKTLSITSLKNLNNERHLKHWNLLEDQLNEQILNEKHS